MARKPQHQQPPSKILTADDLRMGVKKVARRIEDLKSFDVNMIEERFGANVRAMVDKIQDTIAEIYGRDTAEYKSHSIWSLDTLPEGFGPSQYSLTAVRNSYQKGIGDAITKLTALKETLEEKLSDLEGEIGVGKKPKAQYPPEVERKVFIVHGHDELAKAKVARFMSQLGLDPVILHEQPNQGKTIIEKLEAHSAVGFAIALLTPDDMGYPIKEPEQKKPRARQNVILELGYFSGILGRDHVCTLCKGDVEIPTDFLGVVYLPMDDAGAWMLPLAREIRQAGIPVDLNKAFN
jgi:predicted nucleotide-binding protein